MKGIFLRIALFTIYVLMATLIANNALFLHSHYLSDGRVITHAHPFKKTTDSIPFPAHKHSKAELMLLENLQWLFIFVFTLVMVPNGIKFAPIIAFLNVFIIPKFVTPQQGRAPPVFG